jgi:murein DD-endopeptidase MepM/ murein hydrolase activator NlpD
LEIYAMQAQKEEDGGPLGILHESIEVTLPIRPFLTSPIFKSNKIKGYGKEEAFQGSYFPSHQGVDYFAVRGSSVYSACAGVVEGVYQDDVYGTHILLVHDLGFSTMYAHLSKSLVAEGEWLTSGAIIGLVGDSGQSSGAHLHFELLFGGSPIDPIAYFVSP